MGADDPSGQQIELFSPGPFELLKKSLQNVANLNNKMVNAFQPGCLAYLLQTDPIILTDFFQGMQHLKHHRIMKLKII